MKKEYNSDGKILAKTRESLTGRRFGFLTVGERSEDYVQPSTGKRTPRYTVECECGDISTSNAYALTSGVREHCGKGCEAVTNPETRERINFVDLAKKRGTLTWPAPRQNI